MARPLFDSEYLYGLHDPGGEHIMVGKGIPGWVLITRGLGHDPNNHSGDNFSQYSNQNLGVMVRLNNGYGGAGTLPFQSEYDDFAKRCANYVRSSTGARIWIVGNETNHPIEWPGADWDWGAVPPQPRSPDKRGEAITPDAYARCYKKVRAAVHALPGHENDQVLVGGVAPWNPLTTYPGNETGDWVKYFQDILRQIGPGQCDGITLHAYTHGTDPNLIRSDRKVGNETFKQHHWDFRCYQDFMNAVPANMRHLPVYITETDQGDEPWRNENTGWVKGAYGEIDYWNQTQPQKIRALILYRWPKLDQWYIEGKAGVIQDFQDAMNFGYKWTTHADPDQGDKLEALWKQLEALEERFYALQPKIDQAENLDETLGQEAHDLGVLAPDLQGATKLNAQLKSLTSDVTDLEAGLEELGSTPTVPPGAVPRPDILDVMADLSQHASARWQVRPLTDIRRIVLHHTVTRTDVTPQRIAEVHVGQGKPGIAYHYLINGDGTINAVQPLTRIVLQATSSASNQRANADSIAIALAGDFREQRHVEPSAAQRQAAAALIAWLISERKLGGVIEQIVFGRSELGESVLSPGTQWLGGVRYKDKLFADIKAILDAASECADSQELADLRAQVAHLRTEVARLEGVAAQVPMLREEIGQLQITVGDQAAEIVRLRDIAQQCLDADALPDIIDVRATLPHHPTLPPYKNRTQPITKIIIHHTDTPSNFTVEQIAHYHVYGTRPNKDPWPGIGYHYVIAVDGSIYWCQNHETHSYHVGAANGYSLGVSLIGRYLQTGYDGKPQAPEDRLPTPAQMDSASRLAAWLMGELEISDTVQVVGHKEVGMTACPGDQWMRGVNWKKDLHASIEALRLSKPMAFYLLFWDHGDNWASADWKNAQNYIAHFRPTTGFSTKHAKQAQVVLIVGGDAGVSGGAEAELRADGVEVHRLAGANEAETKALLDDLVANDTPWPGSPPLGSTQFVARSLPPIASPKPDKWTIPDDYLAQPPVERSLAPPTSVRRVRVESSLFGPPY